MMSKATGVENKSKSHHLYEKMILVICVPQERVELFVNV